MLENKSRHFVAVYFIDSKRIKVDVEGWAGEGREDRDILSRIRSIPLGVGQYVSKISGLRPATGFYISKF